MTKDEALNIAIDYMNERLEEHDAKFQRHPVAEAERNNILADIEAVKEALAQPEQDWIERERAVGYREGHQNALKQMAQPEQEPVAYASSVDWRKNHLMSKAQYDNCLPKNRVDFDVPLYTTPPQRLPLTDKQIAHATAPVFMGGDPSLTGIARAIEAAHGIKGEA